MKEYLKAQIKTNDAIVKNNFTADEIHRFSASDVRWIDNRCKPFTNRTVKKGEIYQFESQQTDMSADADTIKYKSPSLRASRSFA